MQKRKMASLRAGELWTKAHDLRRWASWEVSRNAVKRSFLWRLGRVRSCSEEGIGSPRQAMTLVFIESKTNSFKQTYQHPSGCKREMGLGGWSPMQVLKAFIGRINSDL